MLLNVQRKADGTGMQGSEAQGRLPGPCRRGMPYLYRQGDFCQSPQTMQDQDFGAGMASCEPTDGHRIVALLLAACGHFLMAADTCRDSGRHQQQQDNDPGPPTGRHDHQQNLQPTWSAIGIHTTKTITAMAQTPTGASSLQGPGCLFRSMAMIAFRSPCHSRPRHANRTSPQDKEVQVRCIRYRPRARRRRPGLTDSHRDSLRGSPRQGRGVPAGVPVQSSWLAF